MITGLPQPTTDTLLDLIERLEADAKEHEEIAEHHERLARICRKDVAVYRSIVAHRVYAEMVAELEEIVSKAWLERVWTPKRSLPSIEPLYLRRNTGLSKMTKGQIEYAIFRARRRFEDWNDVTGRFKRGTSYYYEILAVLEDAVHCGAQEALGIYEPLEGEGEDVSEFDKEPGFVGSVAEGVWFGKESCAGIPVPEDLRKPRLVPQKTRATPNGLDWGCEDPTAHL